MTKGRLFWVTGLSGAGKTTVGTGLYDYLKKKKDSVIIFDGDSLREVYKSTDYSEEGRKRLGQTTNRLCKLLTDQGMDVICCMVGMNEENRTWNRENIDSYYEIYLKVDINELIKRDTKGLYAKALKGEVKNVPGINMDFDEPKNADIVIENYGETGSDDTLKIIIEKFGL